MCEFFQEGTGPHEQKCFKGSSKDFATIIEEAKAEHTKVLAAATSSSVTTITKVQAGIKKADEDFQKEATMKAREALRKRAAESSGDQQKRKIKLTDFRRPSDA